MNKCILLNINILYKLFLIVDFKFILYYIGLKIYHSTLVPELIVVFLILLFKLFTFFYQLRS